MEILIALLLLAVRQVDAATAPFCYHESKCGPPSWPDNFPTCSGSQQSPIDVKTHDAIQKDHLGPFTFRGYNDSQLLLKIEHIKRTVRVTTSTTMQMSGGGLPADYLTVQFHLHWGNGSNSAGSEHWLDGKQASMELHVVHRQKGISLAQAFGKPQGLAVLAFLIQIESDVAVNAAWKNLTKLVKNLTEDGDKLPINGTFSLMDLISSINLTKYFRYNGSLTTPECNEIVLWTVFEEPIRLNAAMAKTFFTDLYVNASQGTLLLNTFRPTQKNENPVWASLGTRQAAPTPTITVLSSPTSGSPRGWWTHPLVLLLPLVCLLPLP